MQKIFSLEKIKNSAFISCNVNNSNNLLSSKVEKKNFCPQIVFDNIEEEKVEATNSNEEMAVKQIEILIEQNPKTTKSKYIRKNKKTKFRVTNMNFAKSGNYLSKNSKRHKNCKDKIIRNFIQDILIYWINAGIKCKIFKKINPAKIPYNFIENKNLKLKDIYKENIEPNCISNITKELQANINTKLNFSLKQAFITFCDESSRNSILKEVIKGNEDEMIEENIYDKLKTKNDYIKEKQLDLRDKMVFEDCFKDLVQAL